MFKLHKFSNYSDKTKDVRFSFNLTPQAGELIILNDKGHYDTKENYSFFHNIWKFGHIYKNNTDLNTLNNKLEVIKKIYKTKLVIIDNEHPISNKISNLSSKYPLIFVHVPKTAGVSISKILELNHKNYLHRHIPLNKIQEKLNKSVFNSTTKFSVVRNPFDRFVSLYKYRIKNKKNWNYPQEYSPHLTFEQWFWDFEIQLRNIDSYENLSQYDFLTDNSGELGVNHILRFERLEEDWNNMFKELKIKTPKLPHLNKTNKTHYSEYFKIPTGDLIKDFIYSHYKKDFDTFGYSFEEKQ
jgi:hypothetical protein